MNEDALKQLLQSADDGAPPTTLSAAALLAAAKHRRRRSKQWTVAASLALCCVVLAGVWRVTQPSPAWLTYARSGSLPLEGTGAPSTGDPKSPERRWYQSRSDGEGGRGGYTPPPTTHPDDLRRELARLDREAEMRLQVVQAVQHSSTTIADVPSAPLDDADLVRLEAARSAAMSWQYAQLMEIEMQDVAVARREYERVAERFPGTTWAALAVHSAARLAGFNLPSL